MKFWQPILEAMESLAANKLRSSLTILGIVIGVAAVIAMLAIGAGAEAEITGSIEGIGTNLLFVFTGGDDNVEISNPQPLTLADAEAIDDPFSAPSVFSVAPVIQGNGEVSLSGVTANTQLTGVTPDYSIVRNWTVTEGEFINQGHMLGRSSVVVLGVEVAETLFGRKAGVIGETIRIEGQPFRVIGVMEEKGGGSFGSEDNVAIVPMTTAQSRLLKRASSDRVDMIMVSATSAESVLSAQEEISQILRSRHRTEIAADDFTVMNQQDFLETASAITGVLTIFLGGIAGISLLVGGIGIMNIMLVSVIERTREIGLRKAMGARKRDILIQFLTESSLLSLVGGLIGIALGWGIGEVVRLIAEASDTALNPQIGLDAVLLATLFSAAVGLFFGLYPANRAASLEPVEALRYE
ncbi:MAG: FtsX-like permease family protein [Chloroflexi bacterium]|jgi:putative ABC transport system permease protein|nr:FtsX-like permease family protein [Chloroflexota bacterium]MBT3669299.1 FtsX-like permease family protein [Chloroflexota bacterium]MBT4003263.1 FtsX-like permease family protein [Chloroflexota bacterium]MBT4306006.1 FtsX-like permease family protein [Chloroflexota bacterium]MBT4532650.1 FtsX-like permease family protein [Chloroflexota bacterium]